MKNIGILNFHYSNCNYGAVLQAAALNEFLEKNGYNAETIDFIPDYTKGNSPIKQFLASIKCAIRNLLKTRKSDLILNDTVFEDFRRKWLPRSSATYHSLNELNCAELQYDAYIVGSDQVWRTKYTRQYYAAYFLSFAAPGIKKIGYAPSFGIEKWELEIDDPKTKETRKLLKQFDAVSVREKSGQAICMENFGINAELVLDPTLLTGRHFFEKIIGEQSFEPEKKIVYYKLDIDEDFNNALKIASDQLSVPVENIYYKEVMKKENKRFAYNSVSSWLRKIRDAELVITDSFHCTCFAILFEKPFLYYPNESRGFARIESLFSLLSIDMKCVVTNSTSIGNIHDKIVADFSPITNTLKDLRQLSENFLLKNLEK